MCNICLTNVSIHVIIIDSFLLALEYYSIHDEETNNVSNIMTLCVII